MAGKYFEELSVGQVFKHQPGRTVTETDNVLFTTLTMIPNRSTLMSNSPNRPNLVNGW